MAFGRNSTDVLFFKRYGVDYLPMMYVALSLFLATVSIFYAAFADRISPERLSIILIATLICLLTANWGWITFSDTHAAYPAYFLLYEAASEILIVHSAHYLSQNFDSMQAKRLFSIVMAGTQIGIITGSLILAISAPYIRIPDILLVWCLLLGVNILMIHLWHKRNGTSPYFRPLHKSSDRLKQAISQVSYGFTLIKTSRLLRSASFALFFMVITFYILCFSVNKIYTRTFTSEEELSRFFGILTATTNGIALLLQIFITNRIIHRFGVKKVNMLFPITSIFSYLTLLSSFTLVPAMLGSINKDAIMPAFRNPVRTIFFSALPANVQGRARATSVVIVLPLALFCCGLMLILMLKTGKHHYFLALGVITAICYLFFNHLMNKAYVREILSTLRSKVLIPVSPDCKLGSAGKTLECADIIKNGATIKLFDLLMDSYPEKANELLSLNETRDEKNITEQLIKILQSANPKGFSDILLDLYNEKPDPDLQALILTTLFIQREPRVSNLIPKLLFGDNFKLQIAAIIGALHKDDQETRDNAVKQWEILTVSADPKKQTATLDLLEYLYLAPNSNIKLVHNYRHIILFLLENGDDTEIQSTLNALSCWPEAQFPGIAKPVTQVYMRSNSLIRIMCVKSSRLFYESDQTLLQLAIEDSNKYIRQEAARVHYEMAGEDAKDIFVMWLTTEANGSPRAQDAYLSLLHDISTDDTEFERIALSKAELAQYFQLGRQILEKQKTGQSAAYQLVTHILQERLKQYIELSVYAMQGFERDEDTHFLSSCINSRDSGHIASACEVLRHFKHRKLGYMLSDLLDLKVINFSKLTKQKFTESENSVLEWCKSLPDPWLSLCAEKALNSLA